jgi:catalase
LSVNAARAMAGVPQEIQLRWIKRCTKADPAYGRGIARHLGIEPGNAVAAE